MRNDHSIAGPYKMLIIHNFIDGKTNPVVKVVVGFKEVSVFNTETSLISPTTTFITGFVLQSIKLCIISIF